ncbi:hypothetical protein BH23ACT6_BH23ACT6_11240 [soil metagenome]
MPDEQHTQSVDDPLAILGRWEAAGGTWRVLGRRDDAVTISLCQCDGGTEADRFTSTNSELADYLAGRTRSDDLL